jgi:hypothetical protein
MTTLRRILTTAALVAAVSGLASASPIITYGVDTATGNDFVTQTITFSSGSLGNLLATFEGFAALGIANATYVNGDTSLDYQFNNVVSNFTVKNTDTQTDTVNFGLQSAVTGDAGITLTNSPSHDKQNACEAVATAGLSTNLSANCGDTFNLVSVTGQAIASGATFTLSGTPITTTLGIGVGNGCAFGVTHDAGSGCAEQLSNNSAYSGSANVSFGVDDTGNYTFSAANNGSNTDLTFNSTVTESGEAEITYEYTVHVAGTPEPTTLALMGGALLGLGLLGKRRGRKT